MSTPLSLTGLSPSPAGFPKTFLLNLLNQLCGPNPGVHALRFGLFPFRSPLLWKSMFLSRRTRFFLFLRLLRCFSSPGSLCIPMDSVCSDWGLLSRVSPFRYLRINEYLLLPVAFRSLSRLSSALSAKASTLRSFLLDLLLAVFYSVRKQGLCRLLDLRFRNAELSFISVCYISRMSWLRIYSYQNLCMKFSRYKSHPHRGNFRNCSAISPRFLKATSQLHFCCQETVLSLSEWRWRDSNSWPPACKAGALPTELHPHLCLSHI